MKQLLAVCLLPIAVAAQSVPLTEQLGKTVLYGDIAISPDGGRVAWSQSTAATMIKEIHVMATSGGATAVKAELGAPGERTDSDPAWSPDSKTLAFFSTAGEKDQPQLWAVNADGAGARKLTSLKGYAQRPRWSRDGKQIAFLYVEAGTGGGPLVAAPATTGIIDTSFHNQRIAVIDAAGGGLRQVSPADLHVYDFDWSPDGRSFVVTAAPGPGGYSALVARRQIGRIHGRADE